MPAATPSWDTCRVYGTWRGQDGAMLAGTYKVTIPVRVTNATDDAIIPAGVFASGALNTTEGLPSLDVQAPASNDPDNAPTGWQVTVEVTFTGATGEKYVLTTPVGGSINLRTVVLAATIPNAQTILVRGVPGGLAELDSTGVVKSAQLPTTLVDETDLTAALTSKAPTSTTLQVSLWNATTRTFSAVSPSAPAVIYIASNDPTFNPATEAPVGLTPYDILYVDAGAA